MIDRVPDRRSADRSRRGNEADKAINNKFRILISAATHEPEGRARHSVRAVCPSPSRDAHGVTRPACHSRVFQLLGALLFFVSASLDAQIQVRTLGGGRLSPKGPDAGFVDGNTLEQSQFNSPFGAAVDSAGFVYIADRDNGALRKLDVAGNRSSTAIRGLNQPVAVAIDSANSVYVLSEGDSRLHKIDRFGNVSTVNVFLSLPTALALANDDTLFVTEASGAIVKVELHALRRTLVAAGFKRPSGIAVLDSGLLAVSDTDRHGIAFLNPNDGQTLQQVGTGFAGFRDGSVANAQFNQPHHLAKAPNGSLLVADRGNHRVRAIGTDGTVSTVYGVDPNHWEGPECTSCVPIILPGWLDGPANFAEAREPVGIAIGRDGKVYTTEVFYHLVRQVTGLSLISGGGGAGGGSGTNLAILPPIISPESGYFPLGQDITVTNPNTNAFFSTSIYYTTDGTDPTTNSARLFLNGNVGTIRWRETTRDLTSLRLIAFVGAQPSSIATGKSATANEIGITRDIGAGVGSGVVLPVTLNLRPGDPVKSLQFRVEVSPESNQTPALADSLKALSASTNDFIPVVASSESTGAARFNIAPYTNGAKRGIAISFIGTEANFSVKNFAVAGMLAVPIPKTARLGDRYRVEIIQPSATSDGAQKLVPLAPMAPRFVTVTDSKYLVGDAAPASWYNADQPGGLGFGDGALSNDDVNNVFVASLGLRVPYSFTDLFDAMDAFPEDSASAAGGDGLIRFLDWQVTLLRSLGLDAARWERSWSASGIRVARNINQRPIGLAGLSGKSVAKTAPGAVWIRQAQITATPVENVKRGSEVDIPVYVRVTPGARLGGLAFRATVQSSAGAPAVETPLQFIPASGEPTPMQSSGPSASVLLCGWPLVPAPAFDPPIQLTRRLGSMRLKIPASAQSGAVYSLAFANADGAPDLQTQYDFETLPAQIWVESPAREPQQIVSDEWKAHFFGDAASDSARNDADPDGDGMLNWMEYLAGTDPTRAQSRLQLQTLVDPQQKRVRLRWLSAPGKTYSLQATTDLVRPNWSDVAKNLSGTGNMLEWTDSNANVSGRFYRLRVEPPQN